MNETDQFLIMINTSYDEKELMEFLTNCFPNSIRNTINSFDLQDHWIEIWKNENADEQMSKDPEEGYLYFRWRIEVTPLRKKILQIHQVEFAKNIVSCLENKGCNCVICANFEHLL